MQLIFRLCGPNGLDLRRFCTRFKIVSPETRFLKERGIEEQIMQPCEIWNVFILTDDDSSLAAQQALEVNAGTKALIIVENQAYAAIKTFDCYNAKFFDSIDDVITTYATELASKAA
jgi:hypothetical protein